MVPAETELDTYVDRDVAKKVTHLGINVCGFIHSVSIPDNTPLIERERILAGMLLEVAANLINKIEAGEAVEVVFGKS